MTNIDPDALHTILVATITFVTVVALMVLTALALAGPGYLATIGAAGMVAPLLMTAHALPGRAWWCLTLAALVGAGVAARFAGAESLEDDCARGATVTAQAVSRARG